MVDEKVLSMIRFCNVVGPQNNHDTCICYQDESALYAFYVEEKEINNCLVDVLDINKLNTEHVVDIIYQEQAVFRVRPVTRCTRYVFSMYFHDII